jgi:hypothetical protein
MGRLLYIGSQVQPGKTHIVRVKVHVDNGEKIGPFQEWTRSEVVIALEQGKTFTTILMGSDGKWRKGQDVHIVTVNGVKYIRTDKNYRASDNLENLPEF